MLHLRRLIRIVPLRIKSLNRKGRKGAAKDAKQATFRTNTRLGGCRPGLARKDMSKSSDRRTCLPTLRAQQNLSRRVKMLYLFSSMQARLIRGAERSARGQEISWFGDNGKYALCRLSY